MWATLSVIQHDFFDSINILLVGAGRVPAPVAGAVAVATRSTHHAGNHRRGSGESGIYSHACVCLLLDLQQSPWIPPGLPSSGDYGRPTSRRSTGGRRGVLGASG